MLAVARACRAAPKRRRGCAGQTTHPRWARSFVLVPERSPVASRRERLPVAMLDPDDEGARRAVRWPVTLALGVLGAAAVAGAMALAPPLDLAGLSRAFTTASAPEAPSGATRPAAPAARVAASPDEPRDPRWATALSTAPRTMPPSPAPAPRDEAAPAPPAALPPRRGAAKREPPAGAGAGGSADPGCCRRASIRGARPPLSVAASRGAPGFRATWPRRAPRPRGSAGRRPSPPAGGTRC